MALTKELLAKQDSLKELTDAQIATIIALSKNDEDAIVGGKVKEIYTTMDERILAETGIGKNGVEKTSDYLARVSKALKDKVTEFDKFKGKIATLEEEKTRLEGVIAKNQGNEELTTRLTQKEAELKRTKDSLNELTKEYAKAKETHIAELKGIKVDGEISRATSGIKFKETLPKSVQDIILSQTIDKLKSMNPDFVDSGDGVTKTLVFRHEDGSVMNNPNNSLNPFTAKELIIKELTDMDVLDNGKPNTGGGTDENGGGKPKPSVSIRDAKSKNEANDIIQHELAQKGLVRDSLEWQEAMDKAWLDNKDVLEKLPMQ